MEFIIIFLLILLNGIFSMSEVALISSRKFKLESKAKKGSVKSRKALELAANPNSFLSTVQIGITLIGLLTGMLSGEKLSRYVQPVIERIDALRPYAASVSSVLILIMVTYLSIVFGELLPKRIGMLFPEKISAVVAFPMNFIAKAAKPFIWLLTGTNEVMLKILGLRNKQDNSVSEEEVKAMIKLGAEHGDIQEIEQSIIDRVFFLGDRKVSELMTPKKDIVWVDINDSLDSIKQKAREKLHSVYPVSDKELDDLKGIVRLKDIFPKSISNESFNLAEYIRPALIVAETLPVYKVLDKFKEKKTHHAIVADEYGSIQGMISIDDALDTLINTDTEEDMDEYKIVKRKDGSWLADGQLPFFVFLQEFDIPEQRAPKGSFNTLGGFILEQLNYLPQAGEKISWDNYDFEVLDLDGLRIDKILVSLKEAEEQE